MICEISVWIYGKPAWDLKIEEKVNVERIRERGKELGAWLPLAADIIEKLMKNGWDEYGTLYDVMLTKKISVEDAKKELESLGIDINNIDLREAEWEEEDEDWDSVIKNGGFIDEEDEVEDGAVEENDEG